MNERILELAEQAGVKLPFGGFPNYEEFDFEKFVELIVRECAGVADDPDTDILRVGKTIREHFGVEK